MARVIRIKPWSEVITCRDCEAEIEIERDDVEAVWAAKRYSFGTPDLGWYVKCPNCTLLIDVGQLIPYHIREWARDQYAQKKKEKGY